MRMVVWSRTGMVLAILLGTGLARIPAESGLMAELRAQGFHPESPEGGLTEKVGVQGAIGLLGGLRYMVAALLELEAYRLWEPPPQWEALSETYAMINLLQPRNEDSWEVAGWHHLYNASGYYRYDARNLTPLQREVLARDYEERGMEILRDGIRWNPGSLSLRLKVAEAKRYKFRDHCAAAEAYREAAELPEAPAFCERFYGYSLAKCPGREREAHAVLRRIYEEGLEWMRGGGPMIWKPTLIVELNRLERELGLAWTERIPERYDEVTFRIATPLRPEESYPVYRGMYERREREGGNGEGMGADPQLESTLRSLEVMLGVPEGGRIPGKPKEKPGEKRTPEAME